MSWVCLAGPWPVMGEESGVRPVGCGGVVSVEVADRIARYTPTTLSPSRWRRLRPEIVGLVAAAGPGTPEDAKSLLATLCRFVSVVGDPEEDAGVSELLTDERVAAYWHARRAAGVSGKTLLNHRGRLQRLLAVQRGVQVGSRSARVRRQGPAPYTEAELSALTAAAEVLSDPVRQTWAWASVLALTVGVVPPSVYAVWVRGGSGAEVSVTCEGGSVTLPAGRWVQALPPRCGAPFSQQDWERLRGGLNRRAGGVRLRADRLRATWLARRLGQQLPLGRVLSDVRASARELDAVLGYLPPAGVGDGQALRHC